MQQKPQQMNFRDVTEATEVSFEEGQLLLAEALNKAVAACVKAAWRHSSKSRVKLELFFAASDGRVGITAILSTKTPKPAGVPALAFVDRDGRLVADDPRQEALPFPQPATPEKE